MTPPVVLFSSGLDSAVLLLDTVQRYGGAQPVYVRAGLAWEDDEQEMAGRFLAAILAASPPPAIMPLAVLSVDMRDVYPSDHWAVRGEAPGFDTPDEDVYLEGRNVVLLSKVSVFASRKGSEMIVIGPLACNPFPDARPEFFTAMAGALSLGLNTRLEIEAPFLTLQKADVIRMGVELGVPFELTLSCMQPVDGLHCGRCSKCRERLDAFAKAGLIDPALAHARATPNSQGPTSK